MALKICESCGQKNGVRAKKCKSCSDPFAFKCKRERKTKTQPIDWKDLVKGNVIKSIQGYGPHTGTFRVEKIDEYGIYCYESRGFVYLNMIERECNSGFIKAHKVELIK